jgi:PilZ domain
LLLPDKEFENMPRQIEAEVRSGPRYLVSFEVRAEWDEPGGTHIMSEGTTENVGPEGTLVHLPRKLPDVGSRVRLEVQGEDGKKLQVVAEVLRIERNAGHPLAALQLLGETDEWKGLIWEPAAPRVTAPPPPIEDDDKDDEEEDELAH